MKEFPKIQASMVVNDLENILFRLVKESWAYVPGTISQTITQTEVFNTNISEQSLTTSQLLQRNVFDIEKNDIIQAVFKKAQYRGGC